MIVSQQGGILEKIDTYDLVMQTPSIDDDCAAGDRQKDEDALEPSFFDRKTGQIVATVFIHRKPIFPSGHLVVAVEDLS